jgi:inner membrane transporter RhtA
VLILSGVEIGGDFLGIVYIFCASMMWVLYLLLGRRVAGLDRGLSGLGVGLVIGGVAIMPFGWSSAGAVLTTPRLLWLCFLVGLFSSAIGYAIDQVVLRRIPMRRFAVLLALLPVTAMVVGFLALAQTPSVPDLVGAALVISGVLVQERDELPTVGEELPG